MPAPVHVVLIARSSPHAVADFERSLAALRTQTVPIAGLTVVVCGDPAPLRQAVDASRAQAAVQAPESIPFGGAVELALARVPAGRAVWLLDEGTLPEPAALAELTAALERQPSVALAAPKVVRAANRRVLESFGVTMTASGRSVELARGEYDQGQHDHADDVLGADVRGMLVREDVVAQLVPDRALLGADEGLDMGVRARLAGRRVALAPQARVQVAPTTQLALTRAYVARVAYLHRRIAYAPVALAPVLWILLFPLALWSSGVALFAKTPGRVAPEWMAAATEFVRVGAIVRSRRRIAQGRTGSWRQVDPLRIPRGELRERQHAAEDARVGSRAPLRFFSGGGAWAVLAALAVSVAAFVALFTWSGIGGGALLPLRRTLAGLWSDALFGLRAEGVFDVGAADPFGAVVALVGSLWPAAPSFALVILWVAALPLAVLGGWFAATRVANGSAARIGFAVLWGVAPPFWDALMSGRPAAVLLHLLLPWLAFAVAAAHRSWTTAGAASLLLVGVLACGPWLWPPVLVAWALGIVAAAVWAKHAVGRVIWVIVPSAAMFAPLVVEQVRRGTPWAILSDPGMVEPAGDAVGAGAWEGLLAGFGAPADLAETLSPWYLVLAVPVVVLALAAPATRRTRLAVSALAVAALGAASALVAPTALLSFANGQAVPVWAGAAASLAWLGLVAASAITIDRMGTIGVRPGLVAAVAVALAAVAIVPQATALHRGAAAIHDASDTTLPAYVAAEAQNDREIGTLALTPLADGSAAATVIWGASETLGGRSSVQATALEATDEDVWLASLAADIVSGGATAVTEPLAEAGISFVLLREEPGAQNADQRVMALTATASMDQRAGFVRVGETTSGVLWRVDGDIAERDGLTASETTAVWLVTALQVALLVAALLLAFPTRATRPAVSASPRIIGERQEADA
ncbi:glycosyltransferase [Microbacterium sp. ZXX196]|uniref:glycosyltransferase n=1 Tax=Microbacterium sp. ZXX196 TaxID=2609291 RepID=UPI0012B9D71B|nr:glycosyltransferase [Microbacterium sp. ZXX196]MTE22750.1 glycosyltransferase [Microbacterium sp. ZXX196]